MFGLPSFFPSHTEYQKKSDIQNKTATNIRKVSCALENDDMIPGDDDESSSLLGGSVCGGEGGPALVARQRPNDVLG